MSGQDQPGVIFRLATLNDAASLADLRWRLKVDDATEFDASERDHFIAAFSNSFSESLHEEPYFHWVADLGGRIIAAMSVIKIRKVPSPQQIECCWGYLTNCYTLPEYRSRGIGGSLLAKTKEWAKEQGFEMLVVWPSERSYSFYGRAGFERYTDPLVFKIDEEN